jgi:hypothetical protein
MIAVVRTARGAGRGGDIIIIEDWGFILYDFMIYYIMICFVS